MKTEVAYCSGCRSDVRLVFMPPQRHGHANMPDGAEIVCLDYRERCLGGTCPNTGKSGMLMGVRLAKSHLNDAAFETVRGRCEACEQVSELEVIGGFARCTVCDTTQPWVRVLRGADPDGRAASR